MTDTTVPADIADRMLRDRQARNLSRDRYAQAIGLTTGKILAIERGRAVKADELDAVRFLFEDAHAAVAAEAPAEAPVDAPTPAASAPAAAASTATDAAAGDVTQQMVLDAYQSVRDRLDGSPSPVPYQRNWGSPDEGRTAMWPRIIMWCEDVHRKLDELGLPQTEPSDPEEQNAIFAREQKQLLADYANVLGRLAIDKLTPPISYPLGSRHPSEITDPAEQQQVRQYLEQTTEWLGSRMIVPGNTVLAGAEPEPEPEPEPDVIDVDIEPEDVPLEPSDEELELLETSIVQQTTGTAFDPDDGIRRITNGELRGFKRCRRRWWLESYRKLGRAQETTVGTAAALGTRIHRCLAGYYVPDGQTPVDPLETLQLLYAQNVEQFGGDPVVLDALTKDHDLADAMLRGYLEWLAETGADEGLTVVAPETRLEVDAQLGLAQPVRLLAKLDVRAIREVAGVEARVFLDHKTVQEFTTSAKTVQFDEQMLHYDLIEYLGYLAEGLEQDHAVAMRTDGAIYNMLRKVKRTAQAKPPFYARIEIRHNIATLQSYWLRVRGTVQQILELTAALDAGADPREVAYPTPTRDCSWDCDFYDVCTMFDDGSRAEDMLAAQFVTINPLRRYNDTNEGTTL